MREMSDPGNKRGPNPVCAFLREAVSAPMCERERDGMRGVRE